MPLQLYSTIKSEAAGGVVQLSLAEVAAPQPKEDEGLIRGEAAPINPSDLGPMCAGADLSTARSSGSGIDTVVTVDVPDESMRAMAGRLDRPVRMGNEGAGTVIAAGSSAAAQALVGKTVAVMGGRMYAEQRVAKAADCLQLHEGTTATAGASSFVNPLTVLGMVETMRMEGHNALVHTAAASNLGQMLGKHCANEGVPLVNIVRRPEQVKLLGELGAEHVCNSEQDGFMGQLIELLEATDATLGFDATGGGRLASLILTAMEVAQSRKGAVGNYGSIRHKQVYIYGGLDRAPTQLLRSYGMAWGGGGWLMPNFMTRIGPEAGQRLRDKVADEITTTFASEYTQEISLVDILSLDAIAVYGKMATGEKYLVRPDQG